VPEGDTSTTHPVLSYTNRLFPSPPVVRLPDYSDENARIKGGLEKKIKSNSPIPGGAVSGWGGVGGQQIQK